MSSPEFDFDAWCELARSDPAAYFRERDRAIAEFIEAQPPHQRERLRALQDQIDGLRITSGTPARALAGIFGLMGDHLQALAGQVGELKQEVLRLHGKLSRPH